jgi:hypothetical protein
MSLVVWYRLLAIPWDFRHPLILHHSKKPLLSTNVIGEINKKQMLKGDTQLSIYTLALLYVGLAQYNCTLQILGNLSL